MEWIILILSLTVALLAIWGLLFSRKSGEMPLQLSNENPSPAPMQNDKMLTITGANYTDVQNVMRDFASNYTDREKTVDFSLIAVSSAETLMLFPNDIDFEVLCYCVNWMHHSSLPPTRRVRAWLTTKSTDTWITAQSANKQVMLYVPDDDTEYDNVYLTTCDGIGYKLGFAWGEESQLLDRPAMPFELPPDAA